MKPCCPSLMVDLLRVCLVAAIVAAVPTAFAAEAAERSPSQRQGPPRSLGISTRFSGCDTPSACTPPFRRSSGGKCGRRGP
jgi:hypothetical protein